MLSPTTLLLLSLGVVFVSSADKQPDWLVSSTERTERALKKFNDGQVSVQKLVQETLEEVRLLENENQWFIKNIEVRLKSNEHQADLNQLIDLHIEDYKQRASDIYYALDAVKGRFNDQQRIDLVTIALVDLSNKVVGEADNLKNSKENAFENLKEALDDNSLSTETEQLVAELFQY